MTSATNERIACFNDFVDEYANQPLPSMRLHDLRRFGSYMIQGSRSRVEFRVYEEEEVTAVHNPCFMHTVEIRVEDQTLLAVTHSQMADYIWVDYLEIPIDEVDADTSSQFAEQLERGLRQAAVQDNLVPAT
jgi:hypothetical protein